MVLLDFVLIRPHQESSVQGEVKSLLMGVQWEVFGIASRLEIRAHVVGEQDEDFEGRPTMGGP